MVRPSAVSMNEPLAWCGKATWATAVTDERVEEARSRSVIAIRRAIAGHSRWRRKVVIDLSYARWRAETTRSIALIPMNGAMIPPTP